MRMLSYVLTSVTLCVGAANVSQASDDLTVISNETANGKSTGVSTQYISSDHMRISSPDGGMIFDLKNGVTTTLNDTEKTYYETTKRDIEAIGAMYAEKMKDPKMKQGMAMMQGMGTAMSASTEVTKTGETRKVAGFNCDVWKISMGGGTMTTTECVTNELTYPVSTRNAFTDYGDSMRKAMSGFGPSADAAKQLAEKMKAIKGYPVATSTLVAVAGMKQTTGSEVTEIRHTAIPASTWAVPAGYTKIENPTLQALAKH